MSRPGGLVGFAVTLLTLVLALAAPAAADPVFGTVSTQDPFGAISFSNVSCNPEGTSSFSWSASGTIPGDSTTTWTESGTVTFGPQDQGTGFFGDRPHGQIISWSSSFSYNYDEGAVTGTKTRAPRPDLTSGGWCSGSGSDARMFAKANDLGYTAQKGSTTETGRAWNTEVGDIRPSFPFRWFQTDYISYAACEDGADNDGDGDTDFPADDQCESLGDGNEAPEDFDAPAITITTPADGASYAKGAAVNADFACDDGDGFGVETCTGDVADGAPIPTGTPGVHTFTVETTDTAGNRDELTHKYFVTDGDGGDLALVQDQNVFTVDAFGRDLTRLTDVDFESDDHFDWIEYDVAWSPGGNRLAFTSDRLDADNSVWLMDADGSDLELLGGQGGNNEFTEAPSWGSKGEIAYQRNHGLISGTFSTNWEIWKVAEDGGTPVRLTENTVTDEHPAFSPDGSKIAFVRDDGGGEDLWVMDADGTDQVQLTESDDDELHPEWSPDGTRIAFTRSVPGDFEIWIADADGDNAELAIEGASDPAWSPDGQRLAFIGREPDVFVPCSPFCERRGFGGGFTRPGNEEIFTAHLDGSDRHQVTKEDEDPVSPDWRPTGGQQPPTPPTISIGDVQVDEGAAGSETDATFTLSLSRAEAGVSVTATTADGSAGTGDYTSKTGTVSFGTGTTATFTVKVTGDGAVEPDETFFVNLTAPTGATIADSQGLGTIRNDDVVVVPPLGVSIGDVTVRERDEAPVIATLPVSLAAPAPAGGVSVAYAAVAGTAATPADFKGAGGTLSFGEGQQTRSVEVAVAGDRLDEPAETLHVDLSAVTGSLTGDTRGTATILDDDAPPPVGLRDAWLLEGDAGTSNAVFRLDLAKPSGKPVSVDLSTADETALAGTDYDARSATVVIPAGAQTATFTVPVRGDTVREPDFERFAVEISDASNPLDNQGAMGTIVDDEPGPLGAVVIAREASFAAPLEVLSRGPAAAIAADAANVAIGSRTLVLRRDGTVRVRVLCPRGACRGAIRLALRGRLLGTARFAARAGRTAEARVRLGRRARRSVGRDARVSVDLTVDGAGRRTKTMQLRKR